MTTSFSRFIGSQRKAACLLPLLVLALLPSCKPSVNSLHHVDVPDTQFGEEYDKVDADARALVAHYIATGEVNYASPKYKLTMLHLAAATHRFWLVEKLLAEGADPNMRAMYRPFQNQALVTGETPALLALRVSGGSRSNTDALLILKALMEKGADINELGLNGTNILTLCDDEYSYKNDSELRDGQAMALKLMALGAKGDKAVALHFIEHGWAKALEALLRSPEGANIRRSMPELLQRNTKSMDGAEGELACLKLLLQDATAEEVRGTAQSNPLFNIASRLPDRDSYSDERKARFAEAMALLLKKGAAPHLPGGRYATSCAADHIITHGWALVELRKHGFNISAPAHHFTEEKLAEQLLDIPADAIRAAEIREQFDTIASIFRSYRHVAFDATRDDEDKRMGHQETMRYRKACCRALSLLLRADKQRACAMLMEHPAWQGRSAWEGEALHVSRGVLLAVQNNPDAVLPQEFIIQAARRMEQEGKPGVAHAFTRLLSRNESAGELIEQLCAEESPLPLRAAAWCCKLERAGEGRKGLPSPGRVQRWLRDEHSLYNIDDEYPIPEAAYNADRSTERRRNLCVVIPELLPYEHLQEYESLSDIKDYQRPPLQKGLQDIGAPLAAHFMGDVAPATLSPELSALRERYGIALAASLEMELALSLYIWENREVFRDPRAHREEVAIRRHRR